MSDQQWTGTIFIRNTPTEAAPGPYRPVRTELGQLAQAQNAELKLLLETDSFVEFEVVDSSGKIIGTAAMEHE